MKLNVPPHPILDREAQDGEGPKGGPPHSSAGRKLHLGGGGSSQQGPEMERKEEQPPPLQVRSWGHKRQKHTLRSHLLNQGQGVRTPCPPNKSH